MRIIEDIEQGSPEWHAMRLFKVTGTGMKSVLSKGRGSTPSKMADTYMMELLAERLTGKAKPFFENDAMRWGTETEPQAGFMYELKTGNTIKHVAFIERNEFIGVSPDGLVGHDGMIEIKCPETTTQLKRALSNDYSQDYRTQIQMQLWVAERQWCDFLSFDPRLDVDAGYLIQRVERDEDFIKDMKEKTGLFITKMNKIYEQLTK